MALVTLLFAFSITTVNAHTLRLPEKGAEHTVSPSVVIVGIGDSGTRGVKSAMQALGVHMCHDTNPCEDNKQTMTAHSYIKELLAAAGGAVDWKEGYIKSRAWGAAVRTERAGALATRECSIQDAGLHADSVPADFKWGYKNPQHTYLMPVMDAAFNGQQQMVAVARDLRDLCSGDNQGQFRHFSDDVADFEIDTRKLWGNLSLDMSELQLDEGSRLRQCLHFVTAVWASILTRYRDNQNFHIVRIEDLAAQASSTSHAVLETLMERVQIRPDSDAIAREVVSFHEHEHSYMGHGRENREDLERTMATCTGSVHRIMRELGYDTDRYALTEAAHPRVIRSQCSEH